MKLNTISTTEVKHAYIALLTDISEITNYVAGQIPFNLEASTKQLGPLEAYPQSERHLAKPSLAYKLGTNWEQ